MSELENSFGCNTCRCTGYRPILKTIHSFGVDASPALCKEVDNIEELTTCFKSKSKICEQKCSTCSDDDWSFVNDTNFGDPIKMDYGDVSYIKVFKEEQIFEMLETCGTKPYMLIDGNTGKGNVR